MRLIEATGRYTSDVLMTQGLLTHGGVYYWVAWSCPFYLGQHSGLYQGSPHFLPTPNIDFKIPERARNQRICLLLDVLCWCCTWWLGCLVGGRVGGWVSGWRSFLAWESAFVPVRGGPHYFLGYGSSWYCFYPLFQPTLAKVDYEPTHLLDRLWRRSTTNQRI